MSAAPKASKIRLVLERDWTLYAFPVGVTPTDERGLAIGEDEIGQIIERAVAGVCNELAATKNALAKAQQELDALHEAVAEQNQQRAITQMTSR